MTKPSKASLPIIILQGEDPPVFPFDEQTFLHLELVMGQKITDEARDQLRLLCDRFLRDIEIEMASEDYKAVERQFSSFQAASEAIWKFAYGSSERDSSASELEDIIEEALATRPVGIAPGDLQFLPADGTRWETYAPRFDLPSDAAYAVRIDIGFLERFALELSIAMHSARAEMTRRAEASRNHPRISADDRFLSDLPKWAKRHDLPYGEYVKGTDPTPFSHFAAGLLNLVPEKWVNTRRDTTAGAVAEQIKRARNRVKAMKKEQNS